jgi:hypothetical protein
MLDTILFAPDTLEFTFGVYQPKCFGETGAVKFNASGGTLPYLYSVDGGSNYAPQDSIPDLAPGDYSLVVMDDSGCVVTQVDTSIMPPPAELTFGYTVYHPECPGDLGCIKFSAEGGTIPYEYSVDGGTTFVAEDSICNLPAGDISLLVMDANGCMSAQVDTSILPAPDELIIAQIDAVEPTTSNATDGSITVVSVAGGTVPYTYSLNDGEAQSENTFTGLGNGSYKVQVIDDNGCPSNVVDTLDFNTSISENSLFNLILFPNPTSGQLTIEMDYDQPELQLEIISMTGQMVLQIKGYTHGGVYRETLDLGHLGKGIYLLRVDGQLLNAKVMIE